MNRRSALGALGTLVLIAGCGIDIDQEPRDITPEDGAPDTTADEDGDADPQPGTTLKIYFLAPQSAGQTSRLQVVRRDVDADPRALFDALLDGLTTADQSARLRTAIPSELALVDDPVIREGIAVLDLSAVIFEATGATLVDALAQIVFTLSELTNVRGVRLQVEGADQEWPTGDGSLSDAPLTVFDFPERNPTSQPDYPAAPSPEAAS